MDLSKLPREKFDELFSLVNGEEPTDTAYAVYLIISKAMSEAYLLGKRQGQSMNEVKPS